MFTPDFFGVGWSFVYFLGHLIYFWRMGGTTWRGLFYATKWYFLGGTYIISTHGHILSGSEIKVKLMG
jgi:hypothetical protein